MARFTASALLTVLVLLGSSMGAGAADIDPTVPSVALGSNYFATQPGSHFNFGGGIGENAPAVRERMDLLVPDGGERRNDHVQPIEPAPALDPVEPSHAG